MTREQEILDDLNGETRRQAESTGRGYWNEAQLVASMCALAIFGDAFWRTAVILFKLPEDEYRNRLRLPR